MATLIRTVIRRSWPVVLLVLAVAVAACGEEEEAGSSADDPIRIAMVGPSASNDLAFTQSMVDSLDRLGQDYNITVDITDGTFVIEDAAVAIRGYAEDGFDIVLAHGSQFGGSLEEIAPDFPDTIFAWGTSRDTFGLTNVYSYSVQSDQGGFINGTIAGHMTESKIIGVVGPIEVGDIKLYIDGFVAGVKSVDPSITVNVNYIDSFSDVALAAEAAQAHVEAGADVMTGVSQMVVGATGVAREHGVLWFGSQTDQVPLGEDVVVASQIYNWDYQLAQIVEDLLAGTVNGRVITADFSNGGLTMAYNPGMPLADDIQSAADAVEAGLKDGSISTGVE